MYLLDGSPQEATSRNTVTTSGRDEVYLMRDSYSILNELATKPEWQDTWVAYVSRTTEVRWAKKCLKLLRVSDDKTMDQLAAQQVRLHPFASCQRRQRAWRHARSLVECLSLDAHGCKATRADLSAGLQEIYPGTKKAHFMRIHENTSIPYEQMVRR